MTKIFKNRMIYCFLVALVCMFTFVTTTAYAAGEETFRLNHNYPVGSFTFTDQNTTKVKTVEGRYLYTYFKMSRASIDQGIASTQIKVTVDVVDADTLQRIWC